MNIWHDISPKRITKEDFIAAADPRFHAVAAHHQIEIFLRIMHAGGFRPAVLLKSKRPIARAVGISQQAVGKWETGKSTPDPATLREIADIFEVSVDLLLGRELIPPASAGAAGD